MTPLQPSLTCGQAYMKVNLPLAPRCIACRELTIRISYALSYETFTYSGRLQQRWASRKKCL